MTTLAPDEQHVLVTEPYHPKKDGDPNTWLRLRCGRESDPCTWDALFIVTDHETPEARFQNDHGCLNTGKAPDVDPEWEFVTTCPVCPDYEKLDTDGDSIWCKKCGATWNMSGTGGEVEDR